MRRKLVLVPTVKEPIKLSPGFTKKGLSIWKLDILGLCEFGCLYCSSNWGNYLRINREPFADLTEQQLGVRLYPDADPALTFHFDDIIQSLTRQLAHKRPSFGEGLTLVFSMLTDGFSPTVVAGGLTEAVLRLVLERTRFRIRILTKNAVVGSAKWIEFFASYPGRFVVGLSCGTTDDAWARNIEVGTSSPSARLRALRAIQDAGVPTYGMMCPIFPDLLEADHLDRLVDQIRPDVCEDIWAEPFNDRANWRKVRDGYGLDSVGYRWMTEVFERGDKAAWSRYATDVYVRLRDRAHREGWIGKLKYLLYEGAIAARDAGSYVGFDGCLLQSVPAEDGRSKNPHLAALQTAKAATPMVTSVTTSAQEDWLGFIGGDS